jgi:hypothetical protein
VSRTDAGRPAHAGPRPSGATPATVAGALRLVAGLSARERPVLVRVLAPLDAPLARHPADRVELEASLRGRGTSGQRLILECWIAGRPRLVASSAHRHLDVALRRVCEGLRRQLEDAATRREPRNGRLLRAVPAAAADADTAGGPSSRTTRRSPGPSRA